MATAQKTFSSSTSIVWACWLWIGGALFLLALTALAIFYDRFPADQRLALAIQVVDLPVLGGFLDGVNAFGQTWIYVTLTLGMAAAFASFRAGFEAVLVLLTFLPRGVNGLIKLWVERPRPAGDLVDVSYDAGGFSFASGHTVGAAVLFGVLFFLIPSFVHWRPLRLTLQGVCIAVVAGAGVARIDRGVHWPSDVIAGYLLALLFLAPALVAYRWWQHRQAARSPVDGAW